jgi:hypothetical protein
MTWRETKAEPYMGADIMVGGNFPDYGLTDRTETVPV